VSGHIRELLRNRRRLVGWLEDDRTAMTTRRRLEARAAEAIIFAANQRNIALNAVRAQSDRADQPGTQHKRL
jgi:hypothetical protein